jgi:hypothetical protein
MSIGTRLFQAGQPRSRDTSAISVSATTHFARATASLGPKARAARRRRSFARTKLPSSVIAIPAKRKRKRKRVVAHANPLQHVEEVTHGERPCHNRIQLVDPNPVTLVTLISSMPGAKCSS